MLRVLPTTVASITTSSVGTEIFYKFAAKDLLEDAAVAADPELLALADNQATHKVNISDLYMPLFTHDEGKEAATSNPANATKIAATSSSISDPASATKSAESCLSISDQADIASDAQRRASDLNVINADHDLSNFVEDLKIAEHEEIAASNENKCTSLDADNSAYVSPYDLMPNESELIDLALFAAPAPKQRSHEAHIDAPCVSDNTKYIHQQNEGDYPYFSYADLLLNAEQQSLYRTVVDQHDCFRPCVDVQRHGGSGWYLQAGSYVIAMPKDKRPLSFGIYQYLAKSTAVQRCCDLDDLHIAPRALSLQSCSYAYAVANARFECVFEDKTVDQHTLNLHTDLSLSFRDFMLRYSSVFLNDLDSISSAYKPFVITSKETTSTDLGYGDVELGKELTDPDQSINLISNEYGDLNHVYASSLKSRSWCVQDDFERVLIHCLKVPASQVTANSEALFYEELLDINPYAQVIERASEDKTSASAEKHLADKLCAAVNIFADEDGDLNDFIAGVPVKEVAGRDAGYDFGLVAKDRDLLGYPKFFNAATCVATCCSFDDLSDSSIYGLVASTKVNAAILGMHRGDLKNDSFPLRAGAAERSSIFSQLDISKSLCPSLGSLASHDLSTDHSASVLLIIPLVRSTNDEQQPDNESITDIDKQLAKSLKAQALLSVDNSLNEGRHEQLKRELVALSATSDKPQSVAANNDLSSFEPCSIPVILAGNSQVNSDSNAARAWGYGQSDDSIQAHDEQLVGKDVTFEILKELQEDHIKDVPLLQAARAIEKTHDVEAKPPPINSKAIASMNTLASAPLNMGASALIPTEASEHKQQAAKDSFTDVGKSVTTTVETQRSLEDSKFKHILTITPYSGADQERHSNESVTFLECQALYGYNLTNLLITNTNRLKRLADICAIGPSEQFIPERPRFYDRKSLMWAVMPVEKERKSIEEIRVSAFEYFLRTLLRETFMKIQSTSNGMGVNSTASAEELAFMSDVKRMQVCNSSLADEVNPSSASNADSVTLASNADNVTLASNAGSSNFVDEKSTHVLRGDVHGADASNCKTVAAAPQDSKSNSAQDLEESVTSTFGAGVDLSDFDDHVKVSLEDDLNDEINVGELEEFELDEMELEAELSGESELDEEGSGKHWYEDDEVSERFYNQAMERIANATFHESKRHQMVGALMDKHSDKTSKCNCDRREIDEISITNEAGAPCFGMAIFNQTPNAAMNNFTQGQTMDPRTMAYSPLPKGMNSNNSARPLNNYATGYARPNAPYSQDRQIMMNRPDMAASNSKWNEPAIQMRNAPAVNNNYQQMPKGRAQAPYGNVPQQVNQPQAANQPQTSNQMSPRNYDPSAAYMNPYACMPQAQHYDCTADYSVNSSFKDGMSASNSANAWNYPQGGAQYKGAQNTVCMNNTMQQQHPVPQQQSRVAEPVQQPQVAASAQLQPQVAEPVQLQSRVAEPVQQPRVAAQPQQRSQELQQQPQLAATTSTASVVSQVTAQVPVPVQASAQMPAANAAAIGAASVAQANGGVVADGDCADQGLLDANSTLAHANNEYLNKLNAKIQSHATVHKMQELKAQNAAYVQEHMNETNKADADLVAFSNEHPNAHSSVNADPDDKSATHSAPVVVCNEHKDDKASGAAVLSGDLKACEVADTAKADLKELGKDVASTDSAASEVYQGRSVKSLLSKKVENVLKSGAMSSESESEEQKPKLVDCNAAFGMFDGKLPMVKVPYHAPECLSNVPLINHSYVFEPELLTNILMFLDNPGHDSLYLAGPSGCGKTSVVFEIAARLKWPLESITLSQRTEVADLIGRNVLRNGELTYEYGPLAKAMIYGEILLLNEIDLLSPGELSALNDVLEGKTLTVVGNGGEKLYPGEGFRIIATANTKGFGDDTGFYQGARSQNQAFLDRWHFIECNYSSNKQEFAMISAAFPSINQDFVKLLLRWANVIRYGSDTIPHSARNSVLKTFMIYDRFLTEKRANQSKSSDLLTEDLPDIAAAIRNAVNSSNEEEEANKQEDQEYLKLLREKGGPSKVKGKRKKLSDDESASSNEITDLSDAEITATQESELTVDVVKRAMNMTLHESVNYSGNQISAPLSERSLLRICRFYVNYPQMCVQECIDAGFASRLPPDEYEFVLRLSYDIFGYGSGFNQLPHNVAMDDKYLALRANYPAIDQAMRNFDDFDGEHKSAKDDKITSSKAKKSKAKSKKTDSKCVSETSDQCSDDTASTSAGADVAATCVATASADGSAKVADSAAQASNEVAAKPKRTRRTKSAKAKEAQLEESVESSAAASEVSAAAFAEPDSTASTALLSDASEETEKTE
ncbi:MAG: AAA family ATPase [Anaerobiospirillum succiniciproducens]|uniref:AAA family ATPase n=1 Tax=Anaerobiospirillum succiniciproducens TaxID=13335 RepID=UPI0026DC86D2|nr:AAA family ATPase [Anaerobiospirillum succiniciproducens]MDO4676489.1 AAA family ATPase [Anaerobiospirillum succiniciproducens]